MSYQDEYNGFVVDTAEKAEWTLNKIREAEAEYDKFMDFYEQQIKNTTETRNHKVEQFTAMLRPYFENVPRKTTKTQESCELPSGKLQLVYAKEVMEPSKTLLDFLKRNQLTEYIKTRTEESAAWGEFKKNLSIIDNRVVTKDGLIVDAVSVAQKPEEFRVVTE